VTEQGIKNDNEKPDYSLVPFAAMDDVVRCLTHGARKYSRDNWKYIEKNRYIAASLRHISKHSQGEVYDPDSNLPHLSHAICSLFFVLEDISNTNK
tara:strand:+ start:905 stop:1192 length:288 start_codon:yes stop_codon:yes gene_type:complete